jgi:hypothetical protein
MAMAGTTARATIGTKHREKGRDRSKADRKNARQARLIGSKDSRFTVLFSHCVSGITIRTPVCVVNSGRKGELTPPASFISVLKQTKGQTPGSFAASFG